MIEPVYTKADFRNACELARGRGEVVGFVPTMGALHEGHLALINGTRQHGASFVAVSIFVNPAQFGPHEDLDTYPRTLEQDLERCRECGVDLVFAPTAEEMYPAGFGTTVNVSELTDVLEGSHRPGHFDGVTTVVAKLLHLAGPSVAVFGQKDYQQWLILQAMVRDLDMPITMKMHPIVREPDGLARSSRNRFLNPEHRTRALSIWKGLQDAARLYSAGERRPSRLAEAARTLVEASADRVDYVEAVDASTLRPPTTERAPPIAILVAARFGQTRLIDNALFGSSLPSPE